MASDQQDLGFGSQIATQHGERLVRRDGSFSVKRVGLGWRAILSLYHSLITIRWPVFVGLVTAAYLSVHVVFACAYLCAGSDALLGPGEGFWRAFFFSVHTFSGIGYGHVTPNSFASNWIATAEALTGLFGLALIAGIIFARFSRPSADIVYSARALIAPFPGGTALMVRVANQRRNQILDMRAEVLISTVDRGTRTTRRFDRLLLERDSIALFPMSWTIVHPIADGSPLAGHTEASLREADAEILVLLSGVDETFSQAVYSRTSYKADEVAWNERFTDIYERNPHGVPTGIDLSLIHQTDPA